MISAAGRVPYRTLSPGFWLTFFLLAGTTLAYAAWIAWTYHEAQMAVPAEQRGTRSVALDPGRTWGVFATFYDDAEFKRPLVAEVIDKPFSFRTEYEFGHLPQRAISARFAGRLIVPQAGSYKFLIDANDGARIWINNQLVFDDWSSAAIHQPTQSFPLPAGPVPFYVEWHNRTDNGWLGILWEGPGTGGGFIPGTAFRPDPQVTRPR